MPEELILREVKVGKKVLVTTLLLSPQGLQNRLGRVVSAALECRTGSARDQTTLQMAELSCNTPQMNEKEVWVHFLAYNMIRLLMAQAAAKAAVHPRHLSFKHTVQLWSAWVARRLCNQRDATIDLLFTLVGQLRVGNRPGRVEPRHENVDPSPTVVEHTTGSGSSEHHGSWSCVEP